jgi:hypothetical protein
MIKKRLLFIMLLSGMIMGLMGCMEHGGNRTSLIDFAVMVYNSEMKALAMNTSTFSYAAPELQNLNENNCILAKFTIDYDNQPSNLYYTVTDVGYQLIDRFVSIEQQGDMIDDYTDSIHSIQLATAVLYNGHLFVQTKQSGTNCEYDYELIFNPDSIDGNEVRSVFLKSKLIKGTPGESSTYTSVQAFDVRNLIATYGKDTIITSSDLNYEQEFRFLHLNFKYQSGIKEGIPVYTQYDTKPLTITVFK